MVRLRVHVLQGFAGSSGRNCKCLTDTAHSLHERHLTVHLVVESTCSQPAVHMESSSHLSPTMAATMAPHNRTTSPGHANKMDGPSVA
jgi:hypothetical protein